MRKLSLCLVVIVLLLLLAPSAAQARHHPMLFETMSAGSVAVSSPGETAEFHYVVHLYWCSWPVTEADCTLMIEQRKGWRSPLETITSVPLGMRPVLHVRDSCSLPPSYANVDTWQV